MLIKEIIENLDIIKIQSFSAKDNTKKKKMTTTKWSMSSLHFSSVTVMTDSLWPHGPQHARPPCTSLTPRVNSNLSLLSQWRHPTISSLSSPSPPTFNLSQHQGLFKWVSSSHQVAKVLEFQLQHQSFQWTFRTDFLWDGLGGSPCCSRDS